MYKILVATLLLISLISPFGVNATSYSFDYTIGDTSYSLVVGDNDFYLPFDSDCMTVEYECSVKSAVEFLINDEIYVSSDLLPEETSSVICFTRVIRKGDCKLTVTGASDCIKNISFNKVSQPVSYTGPNDLTGDMRPVISFSDYDDAIRSAVIINTISPVIKVNGANRYINYDNPCQTPYVEDNEVYLPADTFCEAFGYYYSQNEDTVVLRANNVEFVIENGSLKRQDNMGKFYLVDNNTLTVDDTLYLPVTYYAEAVGKTVAKKDDFIIADYGSLVQDIIYSENFSLLKEEFLTFVSDAGQNVYYVSKSSHADDENPGTYELPFATLEKACEVAKAGDRVIIGSGVYREVLKPLNDGFADKPIIFEAAEGEEVTISALENLGTPCYQEDGLYVYEVDWDLGDGRNQIFYNNEALAEARHPNTHTSDRYYPYSLELSSLWPTQGNIQVTLDGSGNTATSPTDLEQSDDYWAGATLVTLHGRGYGVATAKITSSENGKLFLGDKTVRIWHTAGGSDADEHYDYGYITDTKNAVDSPGEWYWSDDGKLYIYPFSGQKISNFNIEAKKRQLTVDLSDRKYIQIKGINTIGGGMKLSNSEMCVINGGEHKYISHYTFTLDAENGFIDTRTDINDLYDDDAAVYRGEMGIYLGGRNNAIINADIEYSASGGICLAGTYSYICNNHISECGYMGGGTNGIYIFSSPLEDITIVKGGHSLYNNTVDKTGRASLNLSSWNYPLDQINGMVPWVACDIAYNDFINSNILTRDNGAVYAYASILGDERQKLKFHHNIIGNTWVSDGYCAGIYWDNYTQMVECYDNIVFYNNFAETDTFLHVVSKSNHPETFSYVDCWNNVDAGFSLLGKEGLSIDDYPLGKWFATGYGAKERAYPHIEGVSVFGAEDALKSSEVVTTHNGIAYLNGEEEWICFEDVDFGDGRGKVVLYYVADRYNTGDEISVLLDSLDQGSYYTATLNSAASYKDSINSQIIPMDEVSGVHDVYIRCSNYKSAGVAGIGIYDSTASVNTDSALWVTEDDCTYYVSGKTFSGSRVTGTISTADGKQMLSVDSCLADNSGEFLLCLEKTPHNGSYRLNLFYWEALETIRPLSKATKILYEETRFKDAYRTIKFKDAEIYPSLISDGTTVSTYGKNDIVTLENIDFGDETAKAITLKLGLDESEVGKLTVKVHVDDLNTEPILTISPLSTGGRFSRHRFTYNLYKEISGYHDIYFVIEGNSSLPLHMEELKFETEFSENSVN